MKSNNLHHGLTLIEILVALTIGLVLMTGVVSLMISSKRAYNTQSDLAIVQENARFVVDTIAKDARMAGYQGCSGGLPDAIQGLNNQPISGITSDLTSDVLLISFTDTSRNAFAILHCPPFNVYGQLLGFTAEDAYNAVCPPVGSLDTAGNPLPLAPSPLTANLNPFVFDFKTGQFGIPGEINNNDIVVASDCNGSDRYQVSNVTFAGGRPERIQLTTALARTYSNGGQSYGAQLRRLLTHRYYVAGVNGRSVLCRDTLALNAPLTCNTTNPATEILTDGVENMQLRYLINTGSDTAPNFQYVRASGGINWNIVRGIRVTLLMQTPEARTDRDAVSQTYSLDEEEFPNYTPTDLTRLRRVFSNTIMLRNRS